MAEDLTQETPDATSTSSVPESVDAAENVAANQEAEVSANSDNASDAPVNASADSAPVDEASATQADAPAVPSEGDTNQAPQEPDDIQPFIAKVCETIQHEVEDEEVDKFLRAHIKPLREEWDTWRAEAKDAYLHMMASQLVQRKAAKTRIMIYEEFKLPVPSAQTKLFESIKQSQVKPKRCIPVLLLPPNLRPTYSLKK
jgi:hypothetical protein